MWAVMPVLWIVVGAVALLWPRALLTFGPFGKTEFYQRVAKSRPLMMMARLGGSVALIIGALSLSQGAVAPVDTPAKAVALADKACSDSWGRQARQNGSVWHVDPASWQARKATDHWEVWVGKKSDPDISINVPFRGAPDPMSCDLRLRNQ